MNETFEEKVMRWARRRKEIISRVKKGERLVDVARDLNMSRQRVWQIVRKERDKDGI